MESPFSKILLYTYGKVGCTSIKEYNNGEYFEVIPKEYKCKTICTHWPHIAKDVLSKYTDLLIINIVRLPIDRNISSFWQQINKFIKDYSKLSIEEINKKYLNLNKNFSVNFDESWLKNFLFKLLDIDIKNFNFDFEKKYTIIKKDGNTIMFFRYEDYNYITNNILPLYNVKILKEKKNCSEKKNIQNIIKIIKKYINWIK